MIVSGATDGPPTQRLASAGDRTSVIGVNRRDQASRRSQHVARLSSPAGQVVQACRRLSIIETVVYWVGALAYARRETKTWDTSAVDARTGMGHSGSLAFKSATGKELRRVIKSLAVVQADRRTSRCSHDSRHLLAKWTPPISVPEVGNLDPVGSS